MKIRSTDFRDPYVAAMIDNGSHSTPPVSGRRASNASPGPLHRRVGRLTHGTRALFKEGQDMAPRIDPGLRVGSRRAAPSVVHAVGMPVLDLSRGTVRDIDRVPGAFVAQMAERVGMTVLLQASNCDLGQNRRGPDLVVLARDQENRRSRHGAARGNAATQRRATWCSPPMSDRRWRCALGDMPAAARAKSSTAEYRAGRAARRGRGGRRWRRRRPRR